MSMSMGARSGDAIGSVAALWKMRTMIVWFTIASLACTAVMYAVVGPWLESNIRRGFESISPKKIEVRARHQPPWRERPDRDNNILLAMILTPTNLIPVDYGSALELEGDRGRIVGQMSNLVLPLSCDGLADFRCTVVKSNIEFPGLEQILERAAMPNRTLILTTLNQAWAQPNTMIHLFLESFRSGEEISHYLDHLVIVALDQVAYDRCRELHTLCYMLKTEGVDFAGEKFFMTEDYLRMMWRRIYFLKHILQLGYSFVFTDADVMWFRDPFPRFDKGADFQMACDKYTGIPEDVNNLPNGGFLYARSNKRTIDFYEYWYMSRHDYPGLHDQDVLNQIKADQDFLDLGLQFRFLDTYIFSGFCQVSKDLEQVCTMHANCCTGLQRKLHDLRLVLEDWKRFNLLSPQSKHHQRIYWRAPRQCLLSFGGQP